MAEEIITITIDEDGTIKAKTEGIIGEVCLSELEVILSSDNTVKSVKKTDDYFQKTQLKTKKIQKQGV